jgi:tetratricopeptide (TPR) repeat protein
MKISEAYRSLSDEKARETYDSGLRYRRDREEARSKPPPAQTKTTQEPRRAGSVGDEAARLQQAAGLFASGRYDQAESVLKMVLRSTPNSALAYAILGDIARQRGDIRSALTRYSYAVQFDPRNSGYQRRYEELLEQSTKVSKHGYVDTKEAKAAPMAVATLLIALMAIVVSVSDDLPLFPSFEIIDTFTFPFVLLTFLSGIAIGAALVVGGFVDRLRSLLIGASGKMSPFTILSMLAVFSFWIAALTYFAAGLFRDAFTYSASRVFGAVAAITLLFVACGWMSGVISPVQAVLWSGGIVWLGALSGWAVADGFR